MGTSSPNHTTHYEVRVSGLGPQGGPGEFTLSEAEWKRTRLGDQIAVEVHAGALGYPWIVVPPIQPR